MLPRKQQLVEVVRLLEQDNHVFQNDPVPITDSLKASNQPMLERLISRASRIDASQQILQTIAKVDARIKVLIFTIGVTWLFLGFLGLFTLLHAQAVNFFYVLVSLLGLHTFMFLLWLFLLIKGLWSKTPPHAWLFTPSFFVRQSDPITKATVTLYTQQLQQKGMRWYLGKINHQLWLATLVGMLGAIIFLLTVRHYNFNWQSTLLTSDTLVSIVQIMAWLPSQLSFSVPTADDVINSQHIAQTLPANSLALNDTTINTTMARKWSGLLIGSMLCYGILPRVCAWLVCTFMLTRMKFTLPLEKPYYQVLIRGWTTKVVDENDMPTPEVIQAPKPVLNTKTNVAKYACLLETPVSDTAWFTHVLDSEWQSISHNGGMIDSRDDLDELLAILEQQPTQLLIGIRAEALPDRGMMRKLDKIATVATGGIVIKLLGTQLPQRQQQWHEALAERGMALVAD